jgi:hypothetical protein
VRFRALLRPTGVALYLIAYVLPAVGNPEFGQRDLLSGKHSIPGYACAFFSIFWGFAGFFYPDGLSGVGRGTFRSLLLPGLTNPILFTYFGFSLRRRAPRTCRVLSAITLVCAASSVAFFLLNPLVPIYGFYLWLAGIVIIVWPDLPRLTTQIKALFSHKDTKAAYTP